jgi:kynureninase
MTFQPTEEFALQLDREDPLAHFRERFHVPAGAVYLCGNSLGLQPKSVAAAVTQELEDWQQLGVEGHLHARNPWMPYHESLAPQLARLVGAYPSEVVAMNGLTVNLHLMMASFYRPTPQRHKIIIESQAFPSDRYAVESQIRFHGYNPSESLILLSPREGESTVRLEDIDGAIRTHGATTALILIGAVNYYTGQLFPMQQITRLGHAQGCRVGFDLAHAIGNVPLQLHDWGADFSVWCSYKYLNAGPGSVAGSFVHERHAKSAELPRLEGWWGQDKATRFQMGPEFHPTPGAEGWQLSNPPILSMAALRASLDIFDEAGMSSLRAKSLRLTAYLEYMLVQLQIQSLRILTPLDPEARGCQLSLALKQNGKAVFEVLMKGRIICDWREPDCIRIAPVPLYNSFADVHRFITVFAGACEAQGLR